MVQNECKNVRNVNYNQTKLVFVEVTLYYTTIWAQSHDFQKYILFSIPDQKSFLLMFVFDVSV